MKKTKAGRNLLCNKIAANVFGACDEFVSENAESADDSRDYFVELKPDARGT